MTRLELFNECALDQGYQKTWLGVSWKRVDNRMYFQPSKEKIDWVLNIMSALPALLIIRRRLFIVPLGAALGWLSIRRIVRDNPADAYIGISQGGWWASFSSANTGRHAATFGCPNLYRGDAWQGRVFHQVTHYETPTDIVTRLPTWGRKGRDVRILNRPAIRPEGVPLIEWETGHSFSEYRLRM